MDARVMRDLYAYHFWVNDMLMDEVARVPAEKTREKLGASFDSIHGTLAHLYGAERIWLSRFLRTSPTLLPDPSGFASIADIRAGFATVRAELQPFLDGLTDEQLAEPLSWTAGDGKDYRLPLWAPMYQVVNHGTHHRAELADMLTRLGNPPPGTDAVLFFIGHASQL